MDHIKLWQVIKTEEAVGEAHHKQVGWGVERSTVDLGIVLHKEILLYNPPPSVCNVLVCLLIFFGHICPAEKSTILADRVDLWLCENRNVDNSTKKTYRFLFSIEVCSHHTLPVACEGGGFKSLLRIQTPYPRSQIP